MVAKLCARSQGQPEPGVRNAAMISSRRAMSREGFTDRAYGLWRRERRHCNKPRAWRRTAIPDSHKRYYGIFALIQIEQINRGNFRRWIGALEPLLAAGACGLQNIFARFPKSICSDHRLSP